MTSPHAGAQISSSNAFSHKIFITINSPSISFGPANLQSWEKRNGEFVSTNCAAHPLTNQLDITYICASDIVFVKNKILEGNS